MKNTELLNNYTQALFFCASQVRLQNEVFNQIIDVNNVINNDSTIQSIIYSPLTDKVDQIRLINVMTKALNVNLIVHRFLLVLIKNLRLEILSDLIAQYRYCLDRSNNIKNIEVISAKSLLDEEKKQIKIELEHSLQQQVKIEFNLDQSIISGLIIKYDSKLIDRSISNILAQINKIAIS